MRCRRATVVFYETKKGAWRNDQRETYGKFLQNSLKKLYLETVDIQSNELSLKGAFSRP